MVETKYRPSTQYDSLYMESDTLTHGALNSSTPPPAVTTTLLNCNFGNSNWVQPYGGFGLDANTNTIAPYGSYVCAGDYWFKAYINKPTAGTPEGRAELTLNPILKNPDGKTIHTSINLSVPKLTALGKNNQGGCVFQFQETGGSQIPCYTVTMNEGASLDLNAYYNAQGDNRVAFVKSGDQRGAHTIEVWSYLTTGTNGYHKLTYGGVDQGVIYSGRTLATGTSPLQFKCGAYAGSTAGFQSEVWLHGVSIEQLPSSGHGWTSAALTGNWVTSANWTPNDGSAVTDHLNFDTDANSGGIYTVYLGASNQIAADLTFDGATAYNLKLFDADGATSRSLTTGAITVTAGSRDPLGYHRPYPGRNHHRKARARHLLHRQCHHRQRRTHR